MVAICTQMGVSEATFAGLPRISKRTSEWWEQGRREREGAVRRLPRIAAKHPEALIETVRSA